MEHQDWNTIIFYKKDKSTYAEGKIISGVIKSIIKCFKSLLIFVVIKTSNG